jgi:preprotein translocase subunit SecG
MSYTLVTIVHILACFFLVLVVLLQTGKGSDVGAVFGGSSQTIFGSSGAGNFLTKTTTGIAILFMLSSLFLSYGAARQTTESLFDAISTDSPAVQEELPADTPGAGAGSGPSGSSTTGQPEVVAERAAEPEAAASAGTEPPANLSEAAQASDPALR